MTLSCRLASVLQRYGRVMMAAVICGVLIYVIVESLEFTDEARRAPIVVAVPAAIASLVLVVKELISPAKLDDDEAAQPPGDTREPTTTAISTAGAVAWVIMLTGIFLLLGLLITIVLFTVTFMRVYGRERWRTTLLTAAIVFGMIHVFFIQLLGVQVFGGWVLSWLGVV